MKANLQLIVASSIGILLLLVAAIIDVCRPDPFADGSGVEKVLTAGKGTIGIVPQHVDPPLHPPQELRADRPGEWTEVGADGITRHHSTTSSQLRPSMGDDGLGRGSHSAPSIGDGFDALEGL
jgi:hypothetical protein